MAFSDVAMLHCDSECYSDVICKICVPMKAPPKNLLLAISGVINVL